MTVQDIQPAIVYTLTGISDYSFNFEIFEDSNLTVVYADDIGSSPVTWVLNVDYTVTINPDRTGYITVTDTGAAGEITISRRLPRTQEVAWVNNDPLDMVVQENSFDKLTMLIQELDSTQIAYPPGFPLDVEFPYPESEKIIGWNTAGNSLVNYPSYGSFQTLHDEAAAAAAAAAISEANAAASETAAGISEANAAASEAAVAGAEANCAASETAAYAAQVAAEAAQSNAEDAEANAEISAQEAANCAADAASSSFANWEDSGTALQPKVSDNADAGSLTNLISNVFIANDPTADEHAVRRYYLDSMLYESAYHRNQARNGDFLIWQRGTSFSLTSGDPLKLTADCWTCTCGDGAATVTRVPHLLGYELSGSTPVYALRMQQTTVATGSYPYIWQITPDVRKYQNQTITVSFNYYTDTVMNVTPGVTQFFGTGGSATTVALADPITTVAHAWTHESVQITVPSIAGKTIGSTQHYVNNLFNFPISTTFDFYLSDVQIEVGNYETPFNRLDFPEQMNICLPYYAKSYDYEIIPGTINSLGAAIFYSTGYTSSGHLLRLSIEFKRPMAVTPSVIVYGDTTGNPNVVRMASGEFSAGYGNLGQTGFSAFGTDSVAGVVRLITFHWEADTGY